MIALSLAQVADVVGGDLLGTAGDAGIEVSGVTIDSRTVTPGDLFVALPGERTDGHRFVDAAVGAGAAGALVAADQAADVAVPAVVVDDPADALLALGAWVRDAVDPQVIAVTGSNGKTTTKDLVAAAARDVPIVANRGSYNNELGVPLTCCRLTHDTQILVSEVGMRGVGQIAAIGSWLRPTVGVVTSVAPVHLELLGSIEAIARAKAEMVEALDADGVAVLSADDSRVAAMADRTRARVVTFGRSPQADVRAVEIELDALARARFVVASPFGRRLVCLPIPGLHNVDNALAALTATTAVGIDLDEAVAGLEDATVSRWRSQLEVVGDVRVLNDAYNANPTSVAAALRTLCALEAPGRRWAVLGAMAEIGGTSEAEHRATGALAVTLGVDALVTVGPTAAAISAGADAADDGRRQRRWTVDDVSAAAALLDAEVEGGDVVLVKASRSAGLDRVVAGFAARRGAVATPGNGRVNLRDDGVSPGDPHA